MKALPRLWVLFGAGLAYGLAMRIAFGMFDSPPGHPRPGGSSGPMLASFAFLIPALIGALTVYLMEESKRTFVRSLMIPWGPTAMFVLGTGLLLIEGSVCIVMALPLFLVDSSVGGAIMWVVLRYAKPGPGTMRVLLALPLAFGFVERDFEPPQLLEQVAASVHIGAAPRTVWHHINNAVDIRPEEMAEGIAYRIGVPYPLEARTVEEGGIRTRKLRWDKGVAFDEDITDWDENRYIRWRYRFTPESIPPGALDDHVAIGGRHFDLIDTSYRLVQEGGGTRLEILVNYRVGTSFNWYAAWWGRFLIGDSARVILAFYKRRSEPVPGKVHADG